MSLLRRDIRKTTYYQESEGLYRVARQPGTGQISDASEIHVRLDGRQAVFAGTIVDTFEGAPQTRICRVDTSTGATSVITFGPHTDRLPKHSPDGRQIAFLSDRSRVGDFQLYLLDPVSGAARGTPSVDGWVEYFHWSPDGKRIVLAVAGHGADISGGQGAITTKEVSGDIPSWMPRVKPSDVDHGWRRAWVYDLCSNRVQRIGSADQNIWEVVWCGPDALAAVVSPGPGEGLWYSARLHIITVETGATREVYIPQVQLGWPSASPSGKQLSIVEAISSDRWIVAGDLRVIEMASGKIHRVDTSCIDITYTEWRSDRKLLLAGHRGFDTVIGLYDTELAKFTEIWSSREITASGCYVTVSGFGDAGDCAVILESYTRAPEIAVIRSGVCGLVKSFDLGYADLVKDTVVVESVSWGASDGLEMQGWLLRPRSAGPHPLVMCIHGGPVWHWRPVWLGRTHVHLLMLLREGFAVFFPNPRGGSGRGQDFVRRVYGDIGGADARDLLTGLDALVEHGIADPKRLGVTGGSYGAFMTSWLITQDTRFGAAVSVAPHTNQVSEHLLSNIPHFMAMITQDRFNNPGGMYFQRSPIMYAHRVQTPTLNICGALDRCTPPEEAVQFHNALLESNVESVLVTYPEEGHGIRKFPALIDYSARVAAWFKEHL